MYWKWLLCMQYDLCWIRTPWRISESQMLSETHIICPCRRIVELQHHWTWFLSAGSDDHCDPLSQFLNSWWYIAKSRRHQQYQKAPHRPHENLTNIYSIQGIRSLAFLLPFRFWTHVLHTLHRYLDHPTAATWFSPLNSHEKRQQDFTHKAVFPLQKQQLNYH